MNLTEHQQEKLNDSLNILSSGKRLIIKGAAGVGKTYMVDALIKALTHRYKFTQVLVTAPTHKALRVLKDKIYKNININFATTHSALKMKRNINYKDGTVSFKPNFNDKFPPLKGVELLIIDEASMLNLDMLTFIEQYATEFNVRVIFIGDPNQLNPVGEKDSPAFLGKPIIKAVKDIHPNDALRFNIEHPLKKGFYINFIQYPEVELTEIVRQGKDNPIIELSRNLHQIRTKLDNKEEGKGYMFTMDRQKVIDTLATVNGTDELKYLAWTNKEVNNINILVRQRIYGLNPAKIEEGESIIFDEPYKGGEYTANEEVTVGPLSIIDKEFTYEKKDNKKGKITFKVYSFKPKRDKDDDGSMETIYILHEQDEEKFEKFIIKLKISVQCADITWADFYNFKEKFAEFKYNHALTIHKSQGSTFKQAIVNIRDISLNKSEEEKKRLLYTAITRASDLLILYNVL